MIRNAGSRRHAGSALPVHPIARMLRALLEAGRRHRDAARFRNLPPEPLRDIGAPRPVGLDSIETPFIAPCGRSGRRAPAKSATGAAPAAPGGSPTPVAPRGHRLERHADMGLAIGFAGLGREAAEPEILGRRIADRPFAGPLGQFHQAEPARPLLDLADRGERLGADLSRRGLRHLRSQRAREAVAAAAGAGSGRVAPAAAGAAFAAGWAGFAAAAAGFVSTLGSGSALAFTGSGAPPTRFDRPRR